jgi:hypothetical protein
MLTGQIPSTLGDLTNLKHLLLGSNQIDGSIPSEIGNMKNLTLVITLSVGKYLLNLGYSIFSSLGS